MLKILAHMSITPTPPRGPYKPRQANLQAIAKRIEESDESAVVTNLGTKGYLGHAYQVDGGTLVFIPLVDLEDLDTR